MFKEAEQWRKENNVNELYESFNFPEREAVSKIYPQYYHKIDANGRPVYIEQLGRLNIKELFEITTPERLIQQLIYEYEKFQRERLPVCSEIRHELIETSCTILDLKNVGVSQFWKVSSYVQQASKIGQYYYPETMGRFYIINAPFIFTTVWSVIKGWLDPVTTEKIQILGSSYIGELSKQIPVESIPSILGGKCNCPGGCGLSDAGPWNSPEGESIIKQVKTEKKLLVENYDRKLKGLPPVGEDQADSQEGADASAPTSKEEDGVSPVANASSQTFPRVAEQSFTNQSAVTNVSSHHSTTIAGAAPAILQPSGSLAESAQVIGSSDMIELPTSAPGELAPPISNQ
ncbi:hypothetical protein MVES1_000734 [Malassezia vespertilionis]|uniref:uncharacterized protein n=1 Tax=Malassezia vespertilionis TaxID=2020962 RepID=UPI0024B07702|nr:uncharacterized protein MVES1_000734 [Malassezia vespertilionis]WFD05404.1 hypothetical protein MVES1_000734 [Malassezia vespertilionis]